jgi:aspartate aminotransferase
MKFSESVERISISGIREVFEAASEDAINLGLGQPDFPTPSHARQAAVEAIEAGKADDYTGNKGIEPLREAVSEKFARDQGVEVAPSDIVATAGASEALHVAMEAHLGPGDEVLVPDPGFVSYDALAKVAGAEPVPVPLRDDLTLDPAAVEAAITDSTAAFVLNSPGNPTGAVSPPDDVREFGRIASDRDVLCLSDEVYEHTVFDGDHRSPLEFEHENVVVAGGCSKTYSMTGWRLGWVTGASERVERMVRVHQYIQACASAPAQYAAEAALTGPQDVVEEMRASFERRRDLVVRRFDEMGLDCPTPQGAFYAMPAVPEGFVDACLDRGVIVVPGEAFGAAGTGRMRVSYAQNEAQLEEALDRMETALATV